MPGLFRLGFSFLEVGTVTPRPQAGNPRPRLFRLRAQQALINRMGFNNDGLEAMRARLLVRDPTWGPLGGNIGVNRDAGNPVADYVACLRGLYELVDYIAVNVSSPNTPGLRDLQGRTRLDELLCALIEARAALAGGKPAKPLLVKIAPDLAPEDEAALAEVALVRGADGLIISNTTIERPQVVTGRRRRRARRLEWRPPVPQGDRAARPLLSPHRWQTAADRARRHPVRRGRVRQDSRGGERAPAVYCVDLPRPARGRRASSANSIACSS